MDWHRWHEGYQQSGQLQDRLRTVQHQLRIALGLAPPGQVQILSVCAGQGHDILGVVADSHRRSDVRARLVELDGRNVAAARRRIESAGLEGIEVWHGDAGTTDAYDGAVPAGIVLLCGVFGSLTDEHIDSTIAALPQLCTERAQVIWTARRPAPGLFEHACASFDRHGFVLVWTDPNDPSGVARHQFVAQPRGLQVGQRIFRFADEQTLIDLGRVN